MTVFSFNKQSNIKWVREIRLEGRQGVVAATTTLNPYYLRWVSQMTALPPPTLPLFYYCCEYKDGVRAKAIKLQNKFIVPGAAGSSSLGWVGVGCSLNEITVIWDTTPAVTLD